MASVNWEKVKGATEAKAKIMHDDKEQRLLHEHSNEHINKGLTPTNESVLGLSYSEVCAKYDARIAELDSVPGANTRKDRVTLLGLETAVPEGIAGDRDKESAWCRRVDGIFRARFGAENVLETYIHRDEVHDYLDTDEDPPVWKTSRVHLHTPLVPVVEGSLNCKALFTRKNLRSLNAEIEEMTRKEFHCQYQTGKKARKKSVEELKAASFQAAAELGAMGLLEDAEAEREAARQEALDVMSEAAVERAGLLEGVAAELEAQKRQTTKTRGAWVEAALAAREVKGLRDDWEKEVRALTPRVRRPPTGKPKERPQSPQERAAREKAKDLTARTRTALEDYEGAGARALALAAEWAEEKEEENEASLWP